MRVMTVFGTRPEAIKVAPVVHALAAAPDFEPVVVVTGQHRAILDQVLDLFGITAAHDLGMLRHGQTLTDVTTRALHGLQPVLEAERPDVVLVQGDTTTTFAGALAAFYAAVPVVHLEAGLRTGDVRSPYPEEMNRRLTTSLTTLHLPPTEGSQRNLLAEGVPSSATVVTGNTVIDALQWTVGLRVEHTDPLLKDLDDDPRRLLLVTAHRRESWGEGMRRVGAALSELARSRPDLLVVLPMHPNPVVRTDLQSTLGSLPNVVLVEPLPYGEFARLMDRSDVILTDSGGVQEEGPSLGKPVLVMRDTTERPEAVEAGTARLVGTDSRSIVDQVGRLLDDPGAYAAMARAVNPYGDGLASQRVLAALRHAFAGGPVPEPFTC